MERYLFFFLLSGSFIYFFYQIFRRICYIRLGRPAKHTDRPFERLKYFAANVLGQKKVRRYPFFGLCHACIMYGFVILLPAIPNMAAERLFNVGIPFIENNPAYLFIKDLFIILVIVGVTGCLLRRTIRKPDWLKNNFEAIGLLLLIFIIVITEAFYHATDMAMHADGVTLWPAPLAGLLSRLFINKPLELIQTASSIFWWSHFLTIFSLLWIIPNSKHLHMFYAPYNTFWHSLEHPGAINPIALEVAAGQNPGASKLEDFTWKQLFEAYTCAKCGRCNDQCPAFQSDEPVKPKPLQGRFRKHIEERAPLILKRKSEGDSKQEKKFIGDVYKKDFIWGCAMCGSCEEACPVSVEHIPKIIAMRRYLVLVKKDYPVEIQQFFSRIETQGNPWGNSCNDESISLHCSSSELTAGSNSAEYVFFAGCAAFSDPRAGRAAAALKNILEKAGISFATFGSDESCCGETARRLGNEALFQQIVKTNIKRWNKMGVRKIITSCAHCYNTLKNEYPQFGGRWEVIHHTVLLANLLKEGRLKPVRNNNITLTYHDPCYLGRYNGVYREPRGIIRALPGVRLVEMQRSGKWSFCCGAGGGRFWTKATAENLIAASRVQQAGATRASAILTACPYCRILLEEALDNQGKQKQMQFLDIAEFLEMAL